MRKSILFFLIAIVPFTLIMSLGVGAQEEKLPVDSLFIEPTVIGDTTCVDTPEYCISATPETLVGNGWVYFEVTDKTASGEVDLLWGFEGNRSPEITQIEVWTENVPHQTGTKVFEYYDDYVPLKVATNKESLKVEAVSRWDSVPVTVSKGAIYKFRCYFDNDLRQGETEEYYVGFKPSSKSLTIAEKDRTLCILDPIFVGSGKRHPNLVGEWKFEGQPVSAGMAIDSSGNGNDGAIFNNTEDSGKFGKCLVFNGSTAYVDCGNDASLRPLNALTVMAWIKNQSAANREIINYRRDATPFSLYSLRQGDSNLVLVNVNDGTAAGLLKNATLPAQEDVWKHFALVFSRANQTLKSYVNGVEYNSTAIGGDYPLHINAGNLDKLYLGAAKNGTRHADCRIDEVKIFDFALSESDIKRVMMGFDPIGSE